MALGELEPARAAAREHVSRSPDAVAALTVLSELESRLGEIEQAEIALRRAEAISPTDRDVLAVRVQTDARRTVRPETRDALTNALGRSPTHPRLLLAQAALALSDDDLVVARRTLELILERSPLQCCGVSHLGRLALREGDEAAASDALAASRARTPSCFVADELERELGHPVGGRNGDDETTLPSVPA